MKVMKGLQIKNLDALKKLMEGRNQLDCYVALNLGLRSSKTIIDNGDGFSLINEIDDTSEWYETLDDLVKDETISEALEKGAFYVYAYELEIKSNTD